MCVAVALVAVGGRLSPAGAAPARSAGRVPAASADTAAVAYQIDAAHDGNQPDGAFVAPLTKLWSVKLPGEVFYPLIVNGTVYVDAAHGAKYGTSVSAYGLESGTRTWGPVNIGGTYGFGDLAYEGGRVFALNFDGKLTALDAATGAIDWSKQMPGQYAFTSPPTASGGTVYVGGAGSGGTLYAVDETNGNVLWTAGVANGDSSAPAVDSTGVYVSYACEQAYSFTTAGVQRWHHSTGCEGGGGRTDVLHDGRVYIRDDAGMAPAILSEHNGRKLGSFAAGPAPAFDASTMFTLTGGALTATDLTSGSTRWTNSDGPYVSAPLVVNGYVVEGDSTGVVHLIDEVSGVASWTGSAGSAINAPDEHNAVGLTGFAEAEGHLVVPAGNHLAVFASSSAPRVRITSGPAGGAVVGASATFGFTSNENSPTYTCQLDTNSAVACTSPYTLDNLTDGPHTFAVTVTGADGTSLPATASFAADRLAPTPTMTAPVDPFSSGTNINTTWTATDQRSGVASYDLRYRIAPVGGPFGTFVYPSGLQATTATSTSITGARGDTVCASVRARDLVGNLSTWSAPACEAIMTDDRALTASAGWYQGVGSEYIAGTFTGATASGAALTLAGVEADRLAIVATVCNGCGQISVAFSGMATTIVDLQSASTSVQTFTLPALSSVSSGTLTLTVVSDGLPVQIDAVGTSRA